MNARVPTPRKPTKPRILVKDYLAQQIALSGKAQNEIAEEAGFPKPNIISMIKKGQTKLPISKVGPMARSLGVDPIYLFKLVMQEYEPENWEVIEADLLKQPVVTANEMEIIEIIRESNVPNPKVRTDEDRLVILEAISKLKPEGF